MVKLYRVGGETQVVSPSGVGGPLRSNHHHVLHHSQKARLLNPYPTKEITARIRKTTKRIFAPSQDKASNPANPKNPAIRAMTRNTIARRNMIILLHKKLGAVASELPARPGI